MFHVINYCLFIYLDLKGKFMKIKMKNSNREGQQVGSIEQQ